MTLSEHFGLIALNGEEVSSKLNLSGVTKHCFAVAKLLEFILNKTPVLLDGGWSFAQEADFSENEKFVYDGLRNKMNPMNMKDIVNSVENLDRNSVDHFVQRVIDEMEKAGLIDIIPSLAECDLNNSLSNLKVNVYRSAYEVYHEEINRIRYGGIENEIVTDDIACLIWLLKQSGNLNKIFSGTEIELVFNLIDRQKGLGSTILDLFDCNLKETGNAGWKSFLGGNKDKSIFIDTEKMFSNVFERIEVVKKTLESHGHIFILKSSGEIPVAEIDNMLFELVPDAVRQRVINVHGVRLRRVNA